MKYFLLAVILLNLLQAKESCLNCHSDTTSMDDFHDIKAMGCASCHGGDKKALSKELAHKNMVLNPSRLEHAKIFCGKCHKDVVNRVEKSVMNSMSGVLDTLKFQFKETSKVTQSGGIQELRAKPTSKQSLAEDHFSKLCAACHINQDEKIFKNYTPRGGGCVDCHRVAPAKITTSGNSVKIIHPKMSTKIPSSNCLKCHNRSNRIGLSYFGKFESEGYGTPYKHGKLSHKLDKSRSYYDLPADAHHAKGGLDCIDCHSEVGVMGDGKKHLHMEDALDIGCKDCHNPTFKPSSNYPKAAMLSALNGNIPLAKNIAITAQKGTPLYNVAKDGNQTVIYRKRDGKKFNISKLSKKPYHTSNMHQRLDCSACHSKWIPSCYGCHEVYFKDGKQYDWIKHKKTKGQWRELRTYLRYESPALAISYNKKIMPTAPGCQVLTTIYDGNKTTQPFHSFAYAAWDPHTTSKDARGCIDCHFNPLTIGLGNGVLDMNKSGISFMPYYDSNKSSLPITYPIDALINKEGKQFQSFSRDYARGFNKKEVNNIVNAYKCIICHGKYDDKIYKNFKQSKEKFKNKQTPCAKELLK